MSNIEIKDIHGSAIIPYLQWFDDVPKRKQVESESIDTILIKMLGKQYHALVMTIDGRSCGLIVYQMLGDGVCFFKFVYMRSELAQLYTAAAEFLHGNNVTSFKFESVHDMKLWQRVFPDRVKKICATYEFDIAGMFTDEK